MPLQVKARFGKWDEILDAPRPPASARFWTGLRHYARGSLPYSEPPLWFSPTRHYLGAAFLRVGRPLEAEVVYREDLRKSPENGFALQGLSKALAAQGREEEASRILERFDRAWELADVGL